MEPLAHTHAPHNLTLPTGKKSPISHLHDLEADEYAWLRFLFLLFVLGIIFSIWLFFKWRNNRNHQSTTGATVHYHPLSTDISALISDSDDSDDVIDINLTNNLP